MATSTQSPATNTAKPANPAPAARPAGPAETQSDRPLQLKQVVEDMITDKLITKETGEQLLINRRSFQSSQHQIGRAHV